MIRGLLLLPALGATPLAAQLEQITVPKGQVRTEIGGEFNNWDQRFRDGSTESWNADFASDSLGSDRIPELATAAGLEARAKVAEQIARMAAWIEKTGGAL